MTHREKDKYGRAFLTFFVCYLKLVVIQILLQSAMQHYDWKQKACSPGSRLLQWPENHLWSCLFAVLVVWDGNNMPARHRVISYPPRA